MGATARDFPTTRAGYLVAPATSRLRPKGAVAVQVPWVAVVGIRIGTQPLSLAQDALRRAARVVQQDQGREIGAAILLYLAQIGFSPLGEGQHIRWPPVQGGTLERDRRQWRRPYISALTWLDLTARVLPSAVHDILRDGALEGTRRERYAAALRRLPSLPSLRADEGALHDAVRWHQGTFAYPDGGDTPSAEQELVHLARQWALAPRSHRLSETLAAWVAERAEAADGAALYTSLAMVRQGHALTHAVIREHQHRALDEVRSLGAGWERLCDEAAGLHALLYVPSPLFGGETWQFTARSGGTLRITLPEIVGLGREALGRRAWLDPLMAAFAQQDRVTSNRQLDRLRQLLAVLAASPDALLMREDRSSEDAWGYLDTELTVNEPDAVDQNTAVKAPSDDDVAHGDPRRHRPDEETEYKTLFEIAKDTLRDRPDLWDAFYLVLIQGLSYRKAARKLNLRSPSTVKNRVELARRLLQKDPRLRGWLTL